MIEGLDTLDTDTLKVPESRAKNASAIRQRIHRLKADDVTRSDRRRVIQNVIDGAPPYISEKLRSTGQGERANFSLREGEGMADAAKTPFFSLVFRNSRFCNIKCKYGEQAERNNEWSEIVSEEWSQLLSDWNGHGFNAQLRDWQMVVFGVGLPVFEDDMSWQWRARKMSEVLVPDHTPADIDQVAEMVLLRPISPTKLYKLIKNEGAAKTMGWFPERVKRALVKSSPGARDAYGEQWSERWQASLRRGDVSWDSEEHRINIADHFVKEFSGKITHSIMLDDGTTNQNPFKEEEDKGLLFRSHERYESFDQIMQPFFWDIGTGEWHSIKGLGPKIADFCQVSDRTMCRTIDGAVASTGLVLEAADDNASQETQLVTFGNGVIVQPGFKVVQTRFAEHLEGVLAVRRELQNTQQSNVGQYRMRVAAENFEPTLGQAQLNYQNMGQLSEASIDRFQQPLDRLYLEQLRRALSPKLKKNDPGGKESHAFRERCVARGVPEEALDFKNIVSVRAVRGIGSGSPVSMDMATRAMLELLPQAAEAGRNVILRNRAAFVLGQGNVDSVFPPYSQGGAPNNSHAALATLENNALRMPGGQVLLTEDQDHTIHFTIHFADAARHLEQFKTGQADPKMLFVHLNQAGPHTKAHLDSMSGDPTRKAQIGQMQMAWLTLSKLADQLKQQLEEAAKSEQKDAQPQLDPKLVAMMARVNQEMEIKRGEAAGKFMLKKQKQEADLQLKDLRVAHELQLKNMEAAAA